MTATLQSLLSIDARLVAAGQHPLTPWWHEQMARFYTHETARVFVGQVGRGGAKSNTAAKVGLNETLFGDWQIPPGERHYWAYVSRTKDEAAQRLMLLQSFLRTLGIPFDAAGDEIALRDMPRGFRVFACQIGAVSGFRCYGYSSDELCKWQAGSDYSNPAEEVCASLNAMCVTHPGARKLLISSPFGMVDYHFQRFELGDTQDQIVANAPSWIANPGGVTEEDTRKAEPNQRIWNREYGAIPSAGIAATFDTDAVLRAFTPRATPTSRHRRVMVLDPSSGKKDAFSWGIVGWNKDTDGAYVALDLIDGLGGSFWQQVSGDQIVAKIIAICNEYKIRDVHADQRESMMLQSAFARGGLRYHVHDWTSASKPAAVEALRRWFAEGTISLPDHEKLKRELLTSRNVYHHPARSRSEHVVAVTTIM